MKALRLRNRIAPSHLHSAKVWFILGLASVILILAGRALGDRFGLLVGFLLALGLNALILFYTDLRLMNLFRSHELEGRDPWGILPTTRELASTMGSPRPSVHLLEINTPIAFSTGFLPSNSALFVSEELLRCLSPEETRSVIAYELARLKSGETQAATAGGALALILVLIAGIFDALFFPVMYLSRMLLRRPRLPGPAKFLFLPLITGLTRLFVSRSAIFAADKAASIATGDREAMARALWKLEAYTHARPVEVNPADAHLFIVNPLASKRRFGRIEALPSVKQRITKLMGYYPL